MNAVEIEEAVSKLVEEPFNTAEFSYAFLEAFSNKTATIQRLHSVGKNSTKKTNVTGDGIHAVLQRNNIHIAACATGGPDTVAELLMRLVDSPASSKHKAKFALTTDGNTVPAEYLNSEEPPLVCVLKELADHFRNLLELVGISTVRQMSDSSDENTDVVLSKIFRAMDLPRKTPEAAKLRPRSCKSPYVNGGLFGSSDSVFERGTVPKFTQNARSYLLHIGLLDWTRLNPDIFGSMIQTVADDEERGTLGMHHTSVPNILKVLNPLLLDDLHVQLKDASKNPRKLHNLRKRLAPNRVFDPACGSGNFSVIAYKVIRKIEAEINILREESDRASEIPLTNFRGIELRHFAVEIGCLALIIAEYQCDGLYRGQCRCEFSCQSILDHWSMGCLESQPISNSLKRSIG